MGFYEFFVGQSPYMTGLVVAIIIIQFIIAFCLHKKNAFRRQHKSHDKETKSFKNEKVNIKIKPKGEANIDCLDFPENLYAKMKANPTLEMRRHSPTRNKQNSMDETMEGVLKFHDPINDSQYEQP